MGKRGPKPQTDSEKGDAATRKAQALLPFLMADLGDCPQCLRGVGRDEFLRLKPKLEQAGIATEGDRALFIQYCGQYALYERLQEQVTDCDLLIEGKDGDRKNPLLDLYDRSSRTLLALSDKLGLTPSCRDRLSVEPNDEENEKAKRFLK